MGLNTVTSPDRFASDGGVECPWVPSQRQLSHGRFTVSKMVVDANRTPPAGNVGSSSLPLPPVGMITIGGTGPNPVGVTTASLPKLAFRIVRFVNVTAGAAPLGQFERYSASPEEAVARM